MRGGDIGSLALDDEDIPVSFVCIQSYNYHLTPRRLMLQARLNLGLAHLLGVQMVPCS